MNRDPQEWIHEGLASIRAQKLSRGEVQLDSRDLVRMFPELIGTGQVMCGAGWPRGWTMLVYLVLESIQRHNTLGDRNSGSPIRIDQIKEKFGGLRIYYGGGYGQKIPDEIFKHQSWPTLESVQSRIDFAEEYSEFICQYDGRITDIHVTPGWIGFYAKENLPRNEKGEVRGGCYPQQFSLGFTNPRRADRDLEKAIKDRLEQQRKYEAHMVAVEAQRAQSV